MTEIKTTPPTLKTKKLPGERGPRPTGAAAGDPDGRPGDRAVPSRPVTWRHQVELPNPSTPIYGTMETFARYVSRRRYGKIHAIADLKPATIVAACRLLDAVSNGTGSTGRPHADYFYFGREPALAFGTGRALRA